MSEDMGKKIKQIAELLGQDKIPDNIMNLLSLFTASNNTASDSEEDEIRHQSNAPPPRQKNIDLEENLEMVRKVKDIMHKVSSNNDPRIHLLTAVQPFLNKNRQSKINTCIKLLRMSSLTRLFDDFSDIKEKT